MKYLKLFENLFNQEEREEDDEFYDMFTTYNEHTIINFNYLFQFFHTYGIKIYKNNIGIDQDRLLIIINNSTNREFFSKNIDSICNNLRSYNEVKSCELPNDKLFVIHFNHPIKMFPHWWNL